MNTSVGTLKDTTPRQAREQREILGDAPEWAYHLHDCLHETKRANEKIASELAAHRKKIEGRENAIDAAVRDLETKVDTGLTNVTVQLTTLVTLFGSENDQGTGGQGLLGRVSRNTAALKSLQADRSVLRGFLVSLTAVGAIIAVFFKAWIMSLFHAERS